MLESLLKGTGSCEPGQWPLRTWELSSNVRRMEVPEKPAHRSIAVEITARCNQKCAYCYNAWREDRGVEVAEQDSASLRALITSLTEQVDLRYLTLTGGEPLFRSDFLELVDFINSKGLGVVIISNGGLVTDEMASRLAQRRIHYIQITLAGADSETHDAHCGEGTFERAGRAIDRLTAAGIRVGGSYLCTAKNAHQARAVLERFANADVRRVAFNRFNPAGYAIPAIMELLPTRSQVLQALQQANECAAVHSLAITNTMPIPACVLDKRNYPNIKFGSCSAATDIAEYALGPDGAYHPVLHPVV